MRHWATFIELLEQLPPGSHYLAALADDDDLAEQVLRDRKANPHAPPSLREWDGTQAQLTQLIELTQALCAITARLETSLPPPPRPITAADRLEQQQRKANMDDLLTGLLGDRAEIH